MLKSVKLSWNFFRLNKSVFSTSDTFISGSKDRELLEELDKRGIDVFITIDRNIEYQQQFINIKFGTVVIISVSNRFNDLMHKKDKILKAVNSVLKGEIEHVF